MNYKNPFAINCIIKAFPLTSAVKCKRNLKVVQDLEIIFKVLVNLRICQVFNNSSTCSTLLLFQLLLLSLLALRANPRQNWLLHIWRYGIVNILLHAIKKCNRPNRRTGRLAINSFTPSCSNAVSHSVVLAALCCVSCASICSQLEYLLGFVYATHVTPTKSRIKNALRPLRPRPQSARVPALSVCLPACLPDCLSVCLAVGLSLGSSICLPYVAEMLMGLVETSLFEFYLLFLYVSTEEADEAAKADLQEKRTKKSKKQRSSSSRGCRCCRCYVSFGASSSLGACQSKKLCAVSSCCDDFKLQLNSKLFRQFYAPNCQEKE